MREMKIAVPKMVLHSVLLFFLIFVSSCATTKVEQSYSQTPPVYSQVSTEKSQLFKTFAGCGIQIWQNEWGAHENTFAIDYVSGTITVGSVGWWGGAFGCYDNGISNGATFNLTNIKKITFEAKASSYGTIYFNIDENNKNEVDLTPNFKEYTIKVPHARSKTDVLFMIGGVRDVNDMGTQITIKNIAFWDGNGNEVVPKYN
jgi:hypothetical protein